MNKRKYLFLEEIKRILKKLKLLFKSLKSRIFIVIILCGVIPVIILEKVIVAPIEDEMVASKMDRLLSQCNILRNHIVSENYLEFRDSDSIDAELAQLSAMYDGRIILIDEDFVILKDTYVMDENKICVSSDVIRCYKGENITKYVKDENFIEIVLPITNYEKKTAGIMLVTFSTNDINTALDNIEDKMSIIRIILSLLVVFVAFLCSMIFVKPFDRLKKSFKKVSEGYFDNKIELDGYTETENIASSYNDMLDKMKKLDESRQEFVSNVSHELKTPITSIKVLADSLMMQEDVPNEIYKEFFVDIVNEIDRENEIITDLLTLVRLDKKNSNLNITQININELVELILKRLRPIAAKSNIELVLESFRPIIAEVDEVKITSAISNLVENAIKYNVLDGWVRVSLNADHKYFYLKVADSGIGIPEESQEMVFERFYRVDKTRARQTGGTGLGLAITRNIIQLHNGAIKVRSKEGEGTVFTVRIPLNYVNFDRENLNESE